MVSTTGMVVSLKTDLRFPESGQQGHGAQIIQQTGATQGIIWRKALELLRFQLLSDGTYIKF